ncbi:hypothetical protein GQ44DRAFT_602310 [Phaeosphaeriaceae sp. PMI808]|nr:hypothetical protein GQ44DRAFT_602310 [Phaeosphaeriaceae sp. PMI808]
MVRTNKRQRLSPSESRSSSARSTKSNKSSDVQLQTPPPSAPAPKTMSLKLTIPQKELSANERRALAIRKYAAERWIPKLQRDFPQAKEMKDAYNMKLMRHYPDPSSSSVPNFIKPRIDTSPRVLDLLKRFPYPLVAPDGSKPPARGFPPLKMPTAMEVLKAEEDYANLRRNKKITASDEAQHLAWENFASPERGRKDRGREAMVESGLEYEELVKENQGLENKLPEWKKRFTGKYAQEDWIKRL